jgi:hypothetical protein
MKKSHEGGQRKTSGRVPEPHVGIFWLFNGKLLIDSTPLSAAEEYDDFKIYSGNHISVWEKFRQNGTAPPEMEYEEAPRGRVMHNTKTRRFTLLADKCILKDKRLVSHIVSKLNLPNKNTDRETDSHYRCFTCLHGGSEDLL